MAEHKYAEILRAIADGKEIEWYKGEGQWVKVNLSGFFSDAAYYGAADFMGDAPQYRVKPLKVYPTTSFTSAELMEIWWGEDDSEHEAVVRIANEALKRYIDEQHDPALGFDGAVYR